MSPTSPRYYTPEVHPPTPLGKFFDDTMHGSMRYDTVPPPLPRRRTTTSHHKPQPRNIRSRPKRPLDGPHHVLPPMGRYRKRCWARTCSVAETVSYTHLRAHETGAYP
eukprot:1417251-Pyramimonas_sp.AAC.1